jgi:hypothetical protein
MECLNSVQGCNFKTNEEALFKKHAEECDFMWTKCQYSSLGCPYESTKLDVLEHMNSCFVKSVLQSVEYARIFYNLVCKMAGFINL